MRKFLLFWVLLSACALSQESALLEVKLVDIEASSNGALVTKWVRAGETEVKTNEIFVHLPDSVATGDSWSGQLQRVGVYTKKDGTRIPEYLAEGVFLDASPPLVSKPLVTSLKHTQVKKLNEKGDSSLPDISELVYLVKSENSSGTCFIYSDSTGSYVLSNIHVFSGSTNTILKNPKQGQIQIPKQIELANGHDLLRFKIADTDGLAQGPLPKISDSVDSYGNSDGGDVITKNSGSVLGIGNETIEVSCEIVPGNSGGPILNGGGQVIGVASFLTHRGEDQWSEGTRYEKTRRFGIRLDQPMQWRSVAYCDFMKESVYLEALNDALDTIVDCLKSINSEKAMMTFSLPKNLASPQRAQVKLDNIVRYHNKEYCTSYPTKKVKDMISYMYTQIKEASEVVIEDNRPFLNTEWGKKELEDIKSRKERISQVMVRLRDSANKSF